MCKDMGGSFRGVIGDIRICIKCTKMAARLTGELSEIGTVCFMSKSVRSAAAGGRLLTGSGSTRVRAPWSNPSSCPLHESVDFLAKTVSV